MLTSLGSTQRGGGGLRLLKAHPQKQAMTLAVTKAVNRAGKKEEIKLSHTS